MTFKFPGLRSVDLLPILALLLVVMTTAPAKAQDTRIWIDPSGGNYDDSSNWSGGNVANTTNDLAFFGLNSTYDVTLTSGVTTFIRKLWVVDDGDVTFKASGPTSATFRMDIEARFDQNVTLTQGPGLGNVILNVDGQLDVQGGSTFNVLQGSDVTVGRLDMAQDGSNGTMVVDGVGSSLAVISSNTLLGSLGATGTLTFQNGSTGNSLSDVYLMVNSPSVGTTGRMNVLSGSTLQTGNITIGLSPSASAVQEGTLTVDGTSSTLTMTGASTLTVGDDINPNVVSDVIISNAGVMSTGTGAILIQNSGHLDIQAGTFNANGNLTVDGGTITRDSGSGGFNLGSGLTLTAKNTAQINFVGSYNLDQGTTFDIQSGADFVTSSLSIGGFGGNGTLVVDGFGSSVTTGVASGWGSDGNTADVTFRNSASGNLAAIFLANDSTAGTTGIFNVQSGAVVTTSRLTIATDGGATTSGTITVDGVGSSLTQNGFFDLTVGHATEGTATINVQNDGTFTTGAGTTTVNATGSINIGVVGSGTFNATGNLTVNGGTITRTNGTFNLASGKTMTIQAGGTFSAGNDYTPGSNTTFNITDNGSSLSSTSGLMSTLTLLENRNVVMNASAGGDIVAAYLALNDGAMTIDGAGSQLAVTTGGDPGGTHQVGNGSGQVASLTFSDNATGSFVSIDPISTLFVGRNGGTGTINVLTGAELTLLDFNIAAESGNGTAIVNINGVGSEITQIDDGYNLDIGRAFGTTGTLNIENDGVYNASHTGTLNIHATGTLNANGGTFNVTPRHSMANIVGKAGGTLTTAGAVTIDSGTVQILGGRGGNGQMMPPSGATGGVGGSFVVTGGSVTVSGTGVLSTQGGNGGAAPFNTPGGLGGEGGTITVNSGTLTLSDGLISTAGGNGGNGGTGAEDGAQGAHGTIDIAGGTFNINGGEVFTGTIEHPGTGVFNFNGGTLHVENFNGNLDQDGGTLAPGSSPGITTVSGDYNLNAGSLAIELGGLLAGSEHDQISVTGALNLGLTSVLDVFLINVFSPLDGNSFNILDFGSITGTFSAINLPSLAGDLDWDTSNLLIDGTLSVFSTALDGDLDADGFVGITDLNIVLGNWNQNVPPANPAADPSGDNFIGIEDLNVVLGNWNAGTPPSSAANIPEPTVSLILVAGVLGLAGRRS